MNDNSSNSGYKYEWIKNESTNKFEYPLRNGTIEWKNYKNTIEKIRICNIPERILEFISTEELIRLVLNYPFLINIFAYESFIIGIESMSYYFNGIKALMIRKDAGDILLKLYAEMDIGLLKDSDNYMKICVIEMLLEQKNIYKKTNNMFHEMMNQTQISSVSMEKGKLIGIDQVFTPKDSPVKVIRISDYSQAEKLFCDNEFKKAYPNSINVSSCTYNYNCHSYAFYYSSPNNIFWMNDPDPYFSDGSLEYIGNYSSSNQQIIYYDIPKRKHTGIIIDYIKNIVISKWGSGPLMIHDYRDCPYYTNNELLLKYYEWIY